MILNDQEQAVWDEMVEHKKRAQGVIDIATESVVMSQTIAARNTMNIMQVTAEKLCLLMSECNTIEEVKELISSFQKPAEQGDEEL